MGCKFPIVRDTLTGKILKQDEGRCYYKWDTTGTKNHAILTDDRYQLVPCRKCTECRLQYSREWATRCMCESMTHKQSWFLTLTYDEEHVPGINKLTGEIIRNGMYEVHDGEFIQVMTLEPTDITTFKESLDKKLRRAKKKPLRYYYCGEYGSTTFRPHYHMLAFGLELEESDMELEFINNEHQPIYKCQWLEDLWGKGIVRIGAVTWNSAAYVARYIMKKQNGKEGERRKEIIGNIPEYVRMSLKPGIGAEYALMNREKIEALDKIILPGKKAKAVHTVKYFESLYDDLYEQEHGQDAALIRKQERAKRNLELQRMKMETLQKKSTLDWWQQLRADHEAKADAYKKLIRPLE
nr:replication initiation protein [Microvirus sp.]